MFKIESYVTPILLSYVDKYVRDFKPADAQVSLWGGGVALHNLVLKADVLQQEVALPFTLVSGRIHELLIQVPWTKIMSEPIVVTIDTIECILSITQPSTAHDENILESPSRKTQVVEAPPGYMQALVRRIVSNIALRVHHLIVKYVQDDIVMSLNVKHLAVDSAGENWEPTFADIEQAQPVIRRLMRLDDLTLCLDRADADGKIRFYQEPLLYRCRLDFRVLTSLVSANTRRVRSLSIQLRSSKLAWGVTTDQMTLLIRLVKERESMVANPPAPPAKKTETQAALNEQSLNSAEPARTESWTEWAWSWLPTAADREGAADEMPMPRTPVPLTFAAYFDDVHFVFKVMETDGNNRRRARGVMELNASKTAFKSFICRPTTVHMRAGTRSFSLQSRGRCVCGYLDYDALLDEPTIYLCKKRTKKPDEMNETDETTKTGNTNDAEKSEEEWTWPEDQLSCVVVETVQPLQERYKPATEPEQLASSQSHIKSDPGQPEQPAATLELKETIGDSDEFWKSMAPQFFVELVHERSPPEMITDPYENPPIDFQYSDWVEECSIKVQLEPVEIRVCMGLLHRLSALITLFREITLVPASDEPKRTLTVEECEALSENLPQRRINFEILGLYVRVHPWDHSPAERPSLPPLLLDLDLPKISVIIIGPLYSHRVCSAACQMPEDSGPLWQAARLHITVNIDSVQAKICSTADTKARPCGRVDVTAVVHVLLHNEYFTKRESVNLGYSVKIRESSACGSAARLQAAWQILRSLWAQRPSALLRHTTLTTDALNDEEMVAIDLTFEELIARGFFTTNTTTQIITLQAMKATALHESKKVNLKQAWIFSAPDSSTNNPYLRFALQWCKTPLAHSLEYAGLWMEPTAIAIDPLFIAWLAYKPSLQLFDTMSSGPSIRSLPSQYFVRRRTTLPSSSGRGGTRSGSGAEVHGQGRSVDSSEKAESRDVKSTVPQFQQKSPLEKYWSSDDFLAIHERLQRMLVNVEIGLVLLYVTMTTASALDCATVRDAMERHASISEDVIALSLGRLSMNSSTLTKQFWNDIEHNGPTFIVPKSDNQPSEDSFPWKIRLADMSCYTLEGVVTSSGDKWGRTASGLRSQLRIACIAKPQTVLELVTSTVTLSMVTKQLQIKQMPRRDHVKKEKQPTFEEARLRYFKKGMDFKPTTLKEFVRGPAARTKDKATEAEPKPEPKAVQVTSGPVVSLGIHMHADTPPLIIRLNHDQMHVVAETVHCFMHLLALLTRPPLYIPKSTSAIFGSQRSLTRSVSEMEEPQTPSEDSSIDEKSPLISIYESQSARDLTTINVKTFFWFQWVISRVTLVATASQKKLAFNVDDIISSVDLQSHYNQLKIKVASASIKHYARTGSDEWTAGVLDGRVLEAREPTNAEEDNFLSITVTQAQMANLPASWKEELHPKMLEHKSSSDTMLEVYATLAPLEAVIQPKVLDQIITMVLEMAPRSFCPLAKDKEPDFDTKQWPSCYVNAGGLRLLLTVEDENTKDKDDTFIIVIGKVGISPYPENPICRHPVNPVPDSGWGPTTVGVEGYQYELVIKSVAIRCAQFSQLVEEEASQTEMSNGTAGENPALKWSQQIIRPTITPVLHSVDVSCILAPALYVNRTLMYGPAVELNLLSDCALELSLEQLVMAQKVVNNMATTLRERKTSLLQYEDEKQGVCPYALLLMDPETNSENVNFASTTNLTEDNVKTSSNFTHCADSGVDSVTTSMKNQARSFEDGTSALKKSVSIAFLEALPNASEYFEVFVTVGMIELSLYTADDGSPEIIALRPPASWQKSPPPELVIQVTIKEEDERSLDENKSNISPGKVTHSAKSLSENTRNVDVGKIKFENFTQARKNEGNLPLVHITLHQPNLYYWRKKTQKCLQVSLFNAWVGLGASQMPDNWNAVLLSTAKGLADPLTEVPPALATMKIVVPSTASPDSGKVTHGSVDVDVERPVMLEVSSDRLRRLRGIFELIKSRQLPLLAEVPLDDQQPSVPASSNNAPVLYKLKRMLMQHRVDNVRVQTTQVGVTGSQGVVGWDSLSLQVATGGRPERLVVRALLCAAVVAAGPPGDARHVVMQPAMLGVELDASWEAWRRAEGGYSVREPSVRLRLDMDCITLDLRPSDLEGAVRIRDVLHQFLGDILDHEGTFSTELLKSTQTDDTRSMSSSNHRLSVAASAAKATTTEEHFYKDDLRSGAFKIVCGEQLPMAYQVTLHNNAVSWRYPHPRAITHLVAYPLPGQDEETPCVLEVYNTLLSRWETHTRFSVPVGEPREIQLYVPAPDAVFALMWRLRVKERDEPTPPFEFNMNTFMPRSDPLVDELTPEAPLPKPASSVTAEQLSGVVRVDSCFAPQLSPRLRIAARVVLLAVYFHNALPPVSSQSAGLEGNYVSKPQWRAHRVLSLCVRDGALHSQLASPAGALFLLDATLLSDIVECATGTMEHMVEEFRARVGVSVPAGGAWRARLVLSHVHAALLLARLRTLRALAADWQAAVRLHIHGIEEEVPETNARNSQERCEIAAEALEGRITLWIHNSSAAALRVGQEGTEEVAPLGPGTRLAYRWRSPTEPKRLRFALAGPSTDWHWSTSIPFTTEHYRIQLHESEFLGSSKDCNAQDMLYLYSDVEERGTRRCMRLAGRLCLANMLRHNLLYKVRSRFPDSNQWRTVHSGELSAESIGLSVICSADHEMTLKIKFTANELGWSGDIPLKECPKENVPWLVKVPSDVTPYAAVWARVVRARGDGRVLVTVWPLYVLRSHLPLDVDVLLVTENRPDNPDKVESKSPLVQVAPGRGVCSHLLAPGTTAARHNLSFQYRNIECPVTKDSVPLHYGVTDTSVFDKYSPVVTLEGVLADTLLWLKRSELGTHTFWPYSSVTKHWPGQWKPALLQPRCDVTVRYCAVRAGGGCSLEMQLCPVVLLCNAAPIALTLRAHDAAPLCRLDPGTAISPPSAVLTKSFFISVEKGRETFVSGELSVSSAELGQYGEPAPGRVALDHTTDFAVQCNHKVALLTMYYEIKEDINVLGLTATHTLLNRLDRDLLVCPLAVPKDEEEDLNLRPISFKVIERAAEEDMHGTPLCKFWVEGNVWRGSNMSELQLYLCIALATDASEARATCSVPVRLGQPPVRRALALAALADVSVPVVVTQVKLGGRWVITVAPDPCPQLLVHNRTRAPLAVAQPARPADEPTTSKITVIPDCAGTRWHCVVQPGCMAHYSTPSYCLQYPPTTNSTPQPSVTFLTFAKPKMGEPQWCAPVAAADGEQLLQLSDGETVKMRVRTHLHTTQLELRDVDHHDISASDIRKRLMGAFSSEPNAGSSTIGENDVPILERTSADEKLLQQIRELRLAESLSQQATMTLDMSAQAIEPDQATEPAQAFDPAQADEKPGQSSLENQAKVIKESSMLSVETGTKLADPDGSRLILTPSATDSFDMELMSKTAQRSESSPSFDASVLQTVSDNDWDESTSWMVSDRVRLMASSIAFELATESDTRPLIALHLDRVNLLVKSDARRTKTTLSIADLQVDNLQYDTGQYDFAVVATTRGVPPPEEPWPPLWNVFGERRAFATRLHDVRFLLQLTHDSWTLLDKNTFTELSEVEVRAGPLALYVEDAYVRALAALLSAAGAAGGERAPRALAALRAEERALLEPLRLRALTVHPLDLTLTLHTAVRMYIALDQSPLRLNEFKLQNVMTSAERLTHALTVHYLSAAILGAGWVVGGLELLGAPGAVAARVGGATGGVRGVASAAAAALLHSLSAWAGSLARNLDLLTGDEEHARRAAAARRRPPQTLLQGLATGITNFAINILGAVGGIAHHPLVGVAVGETESGATALRRSIVGALAKPISATADLVAYAGHGLLSQTGWDPVPQPRTSWLGGNTDQYSGWRRDCVRWTFRLAEITAFAGFYVLLDGAPVHLLFTHKYLMIADPDSERIVEMIDFKLCSIGPYQGQIIELMVAQRRLSRMNETRATASEDDENQVNARAMARVARYTGAESAGAGAGAVAGAGAGATRVLSFLPAPGRALALHAVLTTATHHNSGTHFALL